MNMKFFNMLIVAAIALLSLAAWHDDQVAGASNRATTDTGRTAEATSAGVRPVALQKSDVFPIPERAGPRTRTSGRVPHVQIGVKPIAEVDRKLHRLAFSLPGVDRRPTIVSLPGATGMWLLDEVPVVRPETIVRGREFAHIHPDGSLHLSLPVERALEVVEKNWGDRHPWADRRDGWGGFVMLFTPQSMHELDIVFQLIVESYNYVTGRQVEASGFL